MDLKSMKVADLKAELAKRGLATDGLKAELVNRLQARLDEEEFGVAFDETTTGTPTATTSTTTTSAAPATVTATATPVAATTTTTTTTTTKPTPVKTEKPTVSALPPPVSLSSSTTTTTTLPVTKDANDTIESALKKEEEDNSKTTTTATDVNNNQLSFEEKKRLRAERFGISVVGTSTNTKITNDSTSKTTKKNKHDDKGSISTVSNKKQKSIFGDTVLPKEEIEKRLERASKFGKDDDPITLELKAMLRKYKYGLVEGDGTIVNTANTTANDTTKDDVTDLLLPKEEIELRLQRAEKFGLVDDEQTIKLKAMLRRYRFS